MARAGLSDEARFELGMAASARERRNSPRHLVYLAGVLVVVGAVACLVEWRSWSRAGREARVAMERQASVAAQVKEYVELRAKSGGTDKERVGFDKMVSTGERLAEAAGLGKIAKPRTPDKLVAEGGLLKPTWIYSKVKSAEAEPLMDWVKSMLDEMPGLRVSSIRLTPGDKGWTMDVTYAAVERAGGGT